MKINFAFLGAFVVLAVVLFSVALFLIGNRRQAFNRHDNFYVEIKNVNGIATGSKVRVDGFDAGQVKQIELPDRPSAKFRLKLDVIEDVHRLVRQDSVVTVESDGVVGDKFMLIHAGSDNSPEAASGFTLRSKEPIELSAMMAKASGVMDQANSMLGKAAGVIDQANVLIPEVRVKIDGTLDSLKSTVDNADGLLTQARTGKGVVGTLLNDEATANQVRQVVGNAQQITDNLNQTSTRVGQMVSDFQARDLPAKTDASLTNIRQASEQVNQVSQQVNATVTKAFSPDSYGADAGENLRQSLSNVNTATGNLNDDAEALKHNFLFRGFFKKRGFYTLSGLSAEQYRNNAYFQSPRHQRFWLLGAEAFTKDVTGAEVLSAAGEQQISGIIGSAKDSVFSQSIVVEGYSAVPQADRQIILSTARAAAVRNYLTRTFHLRSTDIGVVALDGKPPSTSGKNSWDGAAIILLSGKK